MSNYFFIVSDNSNLRIDKYLSEKMEISRSQVEKYISDGLVTVNGTNVKSNYKVKLEDEISIEEKTDDFKLVPSPMELNIIYEDDDILILDKPENIVVHPAVDNYEGTLVNGLLYNKIPLGNASDPIRPGIVHRLDKETSGLLVIAKNDESYHGLVDMFTTRKIIRKYIGIVKGELSGEGLIDIPLARSKNDRRKMVANYEIGKEAKTEFKVIEQLVGYTLAEFNLITGRMHQIRAHMSIEKHPIVGDSMYGFKDGSKLMLHSYKLEFNHPITGELIEVKTGMPKRFVDFIDKVKGDFFE